MLTGTHTRMATESDVIARLVYPMGLTGLDRVMAGLAKVYRDDELVIVLDGPAFRSGWMTIARKPREESVDGA